MGNKDKKDSLPIKTKDIIVGTHRQNLVRGDRHVMIQFDKSIVGAGTEIWSESKVDTREGVVPSVCGKISLGTA